MMRALPLAILLLPASASAQALSQVAGLFNIISGIMLVISILMFFAGLGMWFVRLGTYPTHRDDAIRLMAWGTTVLFVLAALLALVRFVQNNQAIASFILGLIAVALVAWFIITVAASQKEGDESHH